LLAKYAHGSGSEAPLGIYVTFALYSINVIRGIVLLLKTVPRIGETVGSVQEVLRMMDRDPEGPEDPSGGGIGFLPDIHMTHVRVRNLSEFCQTNGELMDKGRY